MKTRMPVLLAGAALTALTAGCASSGAPAHPAAKSTAPAASAKAAAAAKTAARLFFDLYAAKQFKPAYELLLPSAQKIIPEHTWVRVNQRCRAVTPNYTMAEPFVAGDRAVVDVSLRGASSAAETNPETFINSGGHWLFVPDDISAYESHPVAKIVAALKAQKVCK